MPAAPAHVPPGRERSKFLTRYLADTADRIAAFASVRDPRRAAVVLHGDARELVGGPYDGVITSPPYPALIDYHEQHRYAYELLGLDDRRERELGAARGTSKAAIEYVARIAAVLARSKSALRRGARSASSSTTGVGSIPKSWSAPGCCSSTGSSGMSTGEPAVAQVSTSSRSSSVASSSRRRAARGARPRSSSRGDRRRVRIVEA